MIGVVSKKLDAPYKSGPSKTWLKIKNPNAPALHGQSRERFDSAMTDMPETFETFLRIWIAENIGSLGSQTDPTNLKYILRVRADELEKAATIQGFYGELADAARPYGGIEGYVQHQFEEAN